MEETSRGSLAVALTGLLTGTNTTTTTTTAVVAVILVVVVPMSRSSALSTGPMDRVHLRAPETMGGTVTVAIKLPEAHQLVAGPTELVGMAPGAGHPHLLDRAHQAKLAVAVGTDRARREEALRRTGTHQEAPEPAPGGMTTRPTTPGLHMARGRTPTSPRTPEARRTTGSSRTAVSLVSGVATTAVHVTGAAIAIAAGTDRLLEEVETATRCEVEVRS